jgi:hypothetical protein
LKQLCFFNRHELINQIKPQNMKDHLCIIGKTAFFCCLTFSLTVLNASAGNNPAWEKSFHRKTDQDKIRSLLSAQPVEFLENKGQIRDMANKPAPYVLFKAEAPGVNLYMTDKGLTYVFLEAEEEEEEKEREAEAHPGKRKPDEKIKINYERLDLLLRGASIRKENIIKEDSSLAYFNYLSASASVYHVKKYRKVTVKNIYPGIDWVLYNSSQNGFKYDFIVHPGADPNQIELVYQTKKEVGTNAVGDLLLSTKRIQLTENAPYSYLSNSKQKVDSRFRIISSSRKNGRYETQVRFDILLYAAGLSDLVIDPQLVWGTCYGGNSADGVYCADTDPSGNLFICGYGSSANFPLLNAGTYYQTVAAGGHILKFSNNGTLLWSTFFGSPGQGGGPFPPPSSTSYLATDNSGNVFLCGNIASGALPAVNAGTYFQAAGAGSLDTYIAKFSNAGTCLWSTYYGGSLYDDATGLATDQNGNVFLCGTTQSTNFPLQNNTTYFEPTITGSNSGYIVKFDNLGNRLWSTYLKGCGVPKVTTDRNGRVYLTGNTNTLIPLMNPGGPAYYQGTIAGTQDAYVLKFSNSGVHLWGTYYGGITNAPTVFDIGYSLATDKSGNVFVTGATTSTNFPVLNPGGGAYFQNAYAGVGNDMFILKFDSTCTRLWATLFGGSRNDAPSESDNLSIDTCGNIWMGFNTVSRNLPFQQACNGGFFDNSRDTSISAANSNIYLARFSNNGNLLWSSFFGGDGDSHRCTWAADKSGNAFLVGEFNGVTNLASYPTLNAGGTSYYSGYVGGDDLAFAKFSSGPAAAQNFSYSNRCASDTSSQLPQSQFAFGAGGAFSVSPGLTINPANGRLFTASAAPGTYTITYSGTSCDCPGAPIVPQGTATISVLAAPSLSVSASQLTLCVNQQATLTASGANSYTWSTGPSTASLAVNPTLPGTLNYTVNGAGSNGCLSFTTSTISVVPGPTLNVSVNPAALCPGQQATITAGGASTYSWNTGVTTSTLVAVATSTNPLSYTVTGTNSNGCAALGTITVPVMPAPTLSIAATSTILCVSQQGTITVSGAGSYSWSTGSTASSLVIVPNTASTLNYTVTGTGSNGCKAQKTYSIAVSPCTGISSVSTGNPKLTVFPNPNTGEFTIISDKDLSLSLVNELGQFIKQIELSAKNDRKVLITDLASGIYFLKDKNNVANRAYKIVVTK